MKFLHTSDWHIGLKVKTNTMADDQRSFFDQLYKIIKKENVDAVVVAGDIYDSAVVSADAISLYNEAVTKICRDLKTPMIVIAGNHDSGPRLAAYGELLEVAGLYVSGQITRDIKPVSIGNTDFYMLPFFNRDEVCTLFPEHKDKIHSLNDAARVLCDYIREIMDKSRVNVVVAHANIVGAELSESDRAAQIGTADPISVEVFHDFDYVALGHIHKPQKFTETIRYSGTPLKYSFGAEEEHTKGVVIFDTDTKIAKEIPLEMLHDRKSFEGTYDELINLKNVEKCYLKLKVTDRKKTLLLQAEFAEKYPFVLDFQGMDNVELDVSSSLSVDEIHEMSEKDIVMMFFKDGELSEPNNEQLALLDEAILSIASANKEGGNKQ